MKTLVFFSLLFSGFCFGQSVTSQAFNDIQGNNRSWQDMQIGTVFEEVPVEGSPYMDELYKMGIASVNGKEIRLLMRYDAYNDQIELIDKKNKAFNMLKKNNIEAEFDGKTFKVVEYGQKKLVYANPLNQGKVILYFKPRKVFVQAEKPDHGYDSYDPPRYEASHFYLIQKKGETAEEIKFSKGRLLRFLRDKAPELRDYIAQQELKLNTQEDALKLINYYNSL